MSHYEGCTSSGVDLTFFLRKVIFGADVEGKGEGSRIPGSYRSTGLVLEGFGANCLSRHTLLVICVLQSRHGAAGYQNSHIRIPSAAPTTKKTAKNRT